MVVKIIDLRDESCPTFLIRLKSAIKSLKDELVLVKIGALQELESAIVLLKDENINIIGVKKEDGWYALYL